MNKTIKITVSMMVISLIPHMADCQKNFSIEDVYWKFKEQLSKGYRVSYLGEGSLKKITSFSGDVQSQLTNEGEVSSAFISGSYFRNDVLGKREETMKIQIDGPAYFKKQNNRISYSPDLNSMFTSAFDKSPLDMVLMVNKLKNTKDIQTYTVSEGNGVVFQIQFNVNDMVYLVGLDGDGKIMEYTKSREAWGKGLVRVTLTPQEIDVEDLNNLALETDMTLIPTIGYSFPNWTASYLSGEPVSSIDFAGKAMILDFFASWCSPCARAIPHLQKVHETMESKDVIVLGMNYADKRDPSKFLSKLGVSYGVVDADKIGKEIGILNWPTVFIIDKEGILRDIIIGYRGEKTETRIEDLLNAIVEPD